MNSSPRGRIDILLAAEDPALPPLCLRALQKAGLEGKLDVVRTSQEFRAALSAKPFQIVIAEESLAGWRGVEAVALLEQMEKDIPFILLTTTAGDDSMADFLFKSGAGFVRKTELFGLPLAIRGALERKTLREERASLEAQLHQSRKMESVGRLAAGVAHDFNNILTVIQGHVGLLRSEPNLRPEMLESLQQVSRATERACKLTKQLLHFSDKHAVQPERLDLNEVLTHLSMLLQRTLGEDITIQFSYAAELPPTLADRGLVEQLILDLAVNAREMMRTGGQLVISTALVNVDPAYLAGRAEARVGRFVCLTLSDTGCGIDPAALARIFDPPSAAGDAGESAGLMLATASQIVKQHRGWIEAQSKLGQGSTFKVFLPACDPEERIHARPGAVIRGGSETILVVEDEAPVLWTTRNILAHHGYRVLEAGSGVEALAIWHQHQNEIALLLTDIVMPVGVSGQELAEQFQNQKPGLKLIYTSGYSVEAAAKSLELSDGINFLQKPYDADTLAQAVRRCLDG